MCVRTFAESVGERLGVGAHLSELRRTRAGQFKIPDAIALDRLDEVARSGAFEQVLISPDAALSHLPFLNLDAEDAQRVHHGIDVQIDNSNWSDGQPVRL